MNWKIDGGFLVITLWWDDGSTYGREEEVRIPCADIVDAGLAALKKEPSEWQDISTAPKDGTVIDGWDGTRRIPDVIWEITSPMHPTGCWKAEHAAWTDAQNYDLTHWMFRPDPPQ